MEPYVDHLIQLLTTLVEKPIDVASISLALPPGSLEDDHKVHEHFRKAYEAGISVVVAAGNYGPLIDTLSPMATCPWVVSVGAASSDATTLADFSSRGIPGYSLAQPTLVSIGVDVIGMDWPGAEGKVTERYGSIEEVVEQLYKQRGRGASVTEADLQSLSVTSGTSGAVPLVVGYLARIIQIRRRLGLPHNPSILRKVLLNIAVPMSGYSPHEVGAGYIDASVIESYFSALDAATSNADTSLWEGHKGLSEIWNASLGKGVTIVVYDEFD